MLKKIIMYISAFIPMFVIMWIKEIIVGIKNIIENPKNYKWDTILQNPFLIVELLFIVIILVSVFIMIKRDKKTAKYSIVIKKLKNRSAEYYLGYYSLFVLALIGFSLTNPVDLIVMFLLLIVLGIVYIKNDLFFMNPTINILKSYIYEIDYDDEGIERKKIVISSEKLYEGNYIDIDISEFEFTFLRKKY